MKQLKQCALWIQQVSHIFILLGHAIMWSKLWFCLKNKSLFEKYQHDSAMVIEEERRVQKVGGLKLANADGVGTW